MSDHEFNNYLSLLAGLLRLGEKQRRAIAEELRTHLEDRLEELLARGMSREEATRQALAEFGDAAGLAAQFASISRGRRRRWLMRAISFSVAAMLLIAAGLAIFWPGRNAGPGAALVVAQAPKQAEAKDETAAARRPRIEDVLNKSMDLEFKETPLREVASQLTQKTGVTFYLNAKTLSDAGVPLDAPITGVFRNLKLRTILALMLQDLDLAYMEIEEEAFLITTPDHAESRLVIRVYDCRDLLAMEAPKGSDEFLPIAPVRMSGGGFFAVQDEVPARGGANQSQPSNPPAAPDPPGGGRGGGIGEVPTRPITRHELRADRLVNLITTNVSPQSWDAVGGPGSISEYNGLIVISQTGDCHNQVEHLLNMLREAAGLEASKDGKPKVVR